MSTPRTDAVSADSVGFYSCATVPASFCRDLENENRAMLVALREARSQLAQAAIKLEQYNQGPIRNAMTLCNTVINNVEQHQVTP